MKRFPRTSMLSTAELDGAEVVQGRVFNVNLVNWTVDIVAQYDQRRYFDVQVSSAYVHYNNGEGSYVMPEVGAVCVLCIPSDSSPPFVQGFIMPPELMGNTATADAPAGTASHGQPQKFATAASFAGGRPRANMGDIWFRTRDENFIILHRGGVLQLGSTPLAQRIYIPLNNVIHDISGNYAHYNTGGAVSWGVQEGPSIEHSPTQYMHTLRVFADDKFADIRITAGKVHSPVPEPDGVKGEQDALTQLKIGTEKDTPIIYEVVVSPGGFSAESGDLANAGVRNKTVLRFFFDRAGGTFLRAEGNVLISCHKKLRVKVSEDIIVDGKQNMIVTCDQDITINGKSSVSIKGAVVRLGQGQAPVARQGDVVQIILPFTPMVASPTPLPLSGVILSGNSKVLA
jgi:hypothetical protein